MDIEEQTDEEAQASDKEVAMSYDDSLAICGNVSNPLAIVKFRERLE